MKKNYQKTRKNLGRLFIIVGSCIIIFVITINLIDLVKSTIAIKNFKNLKVKVEIEKLDANGNAIHEDDAKTSIEDSRNSEEAAENSTAEGEEVICLLRIAEINLEEAVKEGSTKSVLSSALGHVEDTALPGQDGNCCIAGHRNYVFGKYFNRLDEIEIGDCIELETKNKIYKYEVTGIEIVEPEEVSVLDYIEGYNLTLITCTPFMVGTHRLIVRAKIMMP